jgi:hypothetical protein
MQVVTDFPPTIPLHDVEGTTATDYVRKLDELDRLLNDPDVPIQPELIWCLLDEVAKAAITDRGAYLDTATRTVPAPPAAGL